MKLRYIIIKVKDLQRAKVFYSRFLNMEPTGEEPNRMIKFDLQNIKIGLYNPLADGDALSHSDFGDNCIPAFGVNDIKPEIKRISDFAEIIRQKKVDFHEWFEFKDSEGNVLEVHKI